MKTNQAQRGAFGLRREVKRHAAFGGYNSPRKAVSPLCFATAIQILSSLLLCAFALIPSSFAAATNDLSGLLQKGLFEEEANRNLEAAAQAYQTVSAQFDKDRALAATAIFRLGEIYRKQNKTNEAAAQYERIVREFSDQNTLVTLSRQNIVGLGGTVQTRATGAASTVTVDNLQSQYALLKAQLEQARTETNVLTIAKLLDDADLRETVQNERHVVRTPEALQKYLDAAAARALDYAEKRLSILQSVITQARSAQSPATANQEASPTTDDEAKEIRRIQTLIQNSPDLINAKGDGGVTPVVRAAAAGWLRVVAFLLDHGATMDRSALLSAAASGNKAMVELLIERGADLQAKDDNGDTALHRAAERGYLSVAEALIQHGADVNAHNYDAQAARTPLHHAAIQGRPAIVALLVTKGADVDARDKRGATAISLAAASGQLEVLDKLLRVGAKPDIENDSEMTALGYAAQNGNLAMVKALLAAQANPNAGKYGSTLVGATRHPEVLKVLLSAGARPNVKNGQGGTPLLAAIPNGSFESTALLVQNGADVNTANDNGLTPLQMAVWAQNIPIISLLLSNKADINAQHSSGRTALLMSKEAEDGSRPSSPGIYNGSTARPDPVLARKISTLLRQNGALDDLPRRDRIEVRRPLANYAATAFQTDTNNWNEFSLLELVAWQYGLITTDRNAVWDMNKPIAHSQFWRAAACQFPDLGHVVIRRAGPTSPLRTEIPVNVAALLDSGDCARDVKLKPGDIVEIPEADHAVNEKWAGLDSLQLSNLLHCVARTITVSIKGTPTTIQLSPQLKPRFGQEMNELTRGSFMLKSVLSQSGLLRASSDLSRVTVTRRDGTGGKNQWVLNCSAGNDPDLWLRDEDVIEVPDKP